MPLIINSYAISAGGAGGTAPTIAIVSFDDSTDYWTVETNQPNSGTWEWARVTDGASAVTPDGSGGWTGTTLATGQVSVGAHETPIDIAEGGTTGTAYDLYLYQRNAGGDDSNVLKVDYTADNTVPTVSSLDPADNATGVATTDNLVITFTESVLGIVGKDFYLYDNIDTTPVLVETFTFTSSTAGTGDNGGTIAVSGAAVTINPGSNMDAGVQHSVRWEAGAVEDAHRNAVAVNAGDTAYNFTTASASGATVTNRGKAVLTGAQPTTGQYDFTSKTLGTGKIIVFVMREDYSETDPTITSVTIGGQSASLITDSDAANDTYFDIAAYQATVATGTGTIQVVCSADMSARVTIAWFLVENLSSIDAAGSLETNTGMTSPTWTKDITVDTLAGSEVITAFLVSGDAPITLDWTAGVSKIGTDIDVYASGGSDCIISTGHASGVGAATPFTTTVESTDGVAYRAVGSAVALR